MIHLYCYYIILYFPSYVKIIMYSVTSIMMWKNCNALNFQTYNEAAMTSTYVATEVSLAYVTGRHFSECQVCPPKTIRNVRKYVLYGDKSTANNAKITNKKAN